MIPLPLALHPYPSCLERFQSSTPRLATGGKGIQKHSSTWREEVCIRIWRERKSPCFDLPSSCCSRRSASSSGVLLLTISALAASASGPRTSSTQRWTKRKSSRFSRGSRISVRKTSERDPGTFSKLCSRTTSTLSAGTHGPRTSQTADRGSPRE